MDLWLNETLCESKMMMVMFDIYSIVDDTFQRELYHAVWMAHKSNARNGKINSSSSIIIRVNNNNRHT